MNTYLYDYDYDGNRWSLEITAHNQKEADAIIQSLPLAHYAGVLQFKIPYLLGKWLADLIIWWKNRYNK